MRRPTDDRAMTRGGRAEPAPRWAWAVCFAVDKEGRLSEVLAERGSSSTGPAPGVAPEPPPCCEALRTSAPLLCRLSGAQGSSQHMATAQ